MNGEGEDLPRSPSGLSPYAKVGGAPAPGAQDEVPVNRGRVENGWRWHYAEAERCLALAALGDETTGRNDMRRWSFIERSQGHRALGDSLREAGIE